MTDELNFFGQILGREAFASTVIVFLIWVCYKRLLPLLEETVRANIDTSKRVAVSVESIVIQVKEISVRLQHLEDKNHSIYQSKCETGGASAMSDMPGS